MPTSNGRPRILCISPQFAPMADSEAFCSAKMVAALTSVGADVTVLSCNNVLKENPIRDTSSLWQDAEQLRIDLPTPAQASPGQSISAALRYQTSMYSRWVALVLKQASILHLQKAFDFIYSRSLPMCAHIAGFWCAKTLRLPWVANMNDPWEAQFLPGVAFPNVSVLDAASYRFWLKRTLRTADLVTYPCDRLHAFHANVSRIDHDAAIVPHVGWADDHASADNDLFQLTHAGKLGATENPPRPAKPLLIALKKFLDADASARSITRLTLVGPADEGTSRLISELGLEGNIASTGRVSYEQSLGWIASAKVCVLVEAALDEGIFFPSKLADYLVAGKPVLAISPAKGTAADLGGAHISLVIADQHNSAAIQGAIAGLYQDFRTGRLASRAPGHNLRNRFTPAVVAKEFLEAAETVLQPSLKGLPGVVTQPDLIEQVQLASGVK